MLDPFRRLHIPCLVSLALGLLLSFQRASVRLDQLAEGGQSRLELAQQAVASGRRPWLNRHGIVHLEDVCCSRERSSV